MRVAFGGEINASHSANADLPFDVILRGEGLAEQLERIDHRLQTSSFRQLL